MKLNRHNYEEYFILYLDNELDSEDRRQVEIFASENPDLKAELDMLLQSRVSPDTDIVFENKESLMVHGPAISLNNYEEWLLLYIDNELTEQEAKDVERFAAAHPSVKKDLELFQKTKLQPEAIAFPGKESLYRKEEKTKVIAIRWWKIAVAAVLLIGISTTAVVLLNRKPAEGEIARQSVPKTQPGIKESKEGVSEAEKLVNTDDKKTELAQGSTINDPVVSKKNSIAPKEKPENTLPVQYEKSQIAKTDIDNKKPTNNLPRPENNPYITPVQADANNPEQAIAQSDPKGTLTNSDNKIGATNVTQQPSGTYITKEDAPGPNVNPDVDFASNDGKKNKLRGFFRKVTRTFEKRTNIKATDEDDDRLLIAGLSIKLN